MGRVILLLVAGAVLLGISVATSDDLTERHRDKAVRAYEEEVLAREIATSGLALSVDLVKTAADADQAVAAVQAYLPAGSYRDFMGGKFKLKTEAYDNAIVLTSYGFYGGQEHHVAHVVPMTPTTGIPTSPNPGKLKVKVTKGVAGYCTAVFVETIAEDGTVYPPQMLFAASNTLGGSETTNVDVEENMSVNFLFGVDTNCSERDKIEPTLDESKYDWVRRAFKSDIGDFSDAEEGKYLVIDKHLTKDEWQLAFEDKNDYFAAELLDVKANGNFGVVDSKSSWDPVLQTFGSTGWMRNSVSGYRTFTDTAPIPDFEDIVLEVSFVGKSGSDPA